MPSWPRKNPKKSDIESTSFTHYQGRAYFHLKGFGFVFGIASRPKPSYTKRMPKKDPEDSPHLSKEEMEQLKEEEVLGEDKSFPSDELKPTFTRESKEEESEQTFRTNNIEDVPPVHSEHNFDDLTQLTSHPAEQTIVRPQFEAASGLPPMRASTPPPFGQRSPALDGVYGHPRKGKESNLLHLIILILIGAGVIGATVFLLKGGSLGGGTSKPSPSPASPVAQLPTPSPTPQAIDRSKYTVNVLNGTGKTGLAATVMTKLIGLGYKSGKTANATSSAIEQTTVRVKPALATVAAQLVQDLVPDYAAIVAADLKASDVVDLEVVLGLK